VHSRILVTGGAGFVGSSLAISMAQHASVPTKVTALDNLKRRGSEMNLPRLAGAGVEFRHGDIRCPEDLTGLEPGLIVDCSAEPSVLAGYDGSPQYLIRSNLEGTFHTLELARRTRADLIFLSTSRVYPIAALNSLAFAEEPTRFRLLDNQPLTGVSSQGIGETFPLEGARSLYGMTKLASELMVQEYADAYGLRAIINRCGLIAGPWQMPRSDQGVVALWVAAHYFRRPLRYIGFGGSGKQVRDMLSIADLTGLIHHQIENFTRLQGGVFNAGGGLPGSASLRELTDLCREITSNVVPIEPSSEDRRADIPIYISDCRRLASVASWAPSQSKLALLSSIHEWIRTNERSLASVLTASL